MATVLVVEDSPTNMELASSLLEMAGHRILKATDAEQGLALARSEMPDLILMDLHLPGMDGLTAAHLLKDDPATRSIPIVALTASAMQDDDDRIRQAGCDGYIAKPLRYKEFLAELGRLLAARENKPF